MKLYTSLTVHYTFVETKTISVLVYMTVMMKQKKLIVNTFISSLTKRGNSKYYGNPESKEPKKSSSGTLFLSSHSLIIPLTSVLYMT